MGCVHTKNIPTPKLPPPKPPTPHGSQFVAPLTKIHIVVGASMDVVREVEKEMQTLALKLYICCKMLGIPEMSINYVVDTVLVTFIDKRRALTTDALKSAFCEMVLFNYSKKTHSEVVKTMLQAEMDEPDTNSVVRELMKRLFLSAEYDFGLRMPSIP